MVATGADFQWKDLKYFTYASDSANLVDSAYSIRNVQVVGTHYRSGAQAVYAGPGLGPSEIMEGRHQMTIDFEAQVIGVRPWWTICGVTDTSYAGTSNVQTAFYVDLNFYGADSATFQLKYRFKNCRFSSLDMGSRHGEELKMRGSIEVGDGKVIGAPDTV